MNTAQEYSDGLDKEAILAGAINRGVKSLFGVKAGIASAKTLSAGKKASGWLKNQHSSYTKGSMYKAVGNKPLYALGAATAFGAGRATGNPSQGQGVQINLPGSRQVRI